jgi:hypothetical protein
VAIDCPAVQTCPNPRHTAAMRRWVLLPLVGLLAWLLPSSPALANWSVPLPKEANGSLTVAPDTTVFVGSCTDLTSGGSQLWQLPEVLSRTPDCMDAATDSEGNTYTLTEESAGQPVVESLRPTGSTRWSVPTDGFTSFRTQPVLGANGSVFFSMWNGAYAKVVGYDEQTGAVTLEHQFYDVTGLHAYSGGLIVVNTDSKVIYLGYEGATLAEYSTGAPISAYVAYSNASGAGGTLFVAGYDEGCGSEGHASVEKFTPTGLAWTWTDPATYCTQTSLTATPEGGVIFARSEANPSAYFTSISASGHELWTDNMPGPIGPANNAGYFPVRVDVNGVVALPATNIYRCSVQPNEACLGAQVELVSAQTGATVYEPVQLQGEGEYGFELFSDAIGAERLYITGEVLEPSAVPVLDAFAIPGLGEDYQVALQEELTGKASLPPTVASGGSSSSSGGSGASPNSGGGGGSGPPAPSSNPCVPSHGSLIHELLASIKCTAHELKLEVECGVEIAKLLYLPSTKLKLIEAATSVNVIATLPAKLKPTATLFYHLIHYKYSKHAPPGFRNASQALKTILGIKQAYKLIEKLPDIAKALSKSELSQFAFDLDEVLGLKSCVQAVADGLAG